MITINNTGFPLLYSFSEFAENAQEALKASLLGLGLVFASLIILWLAIELFRICFEAVTGKEKDKIVKTEPAEAIQPVAASEEECTGENEEENEMVVAAITAALSEYLGKPKNDFRLVSFRKISNSAHWNK